MAVPSKFTGYGALSPETWKDLKQIEFEPKPFEEYDVDIKIEYCGVCGSDLHTLRSGWGPTMYPCIVGHEIVGKAVRIGSKVTTIKVGDTVGVGANAWSCGECRSCLSDSEQYCPDLVETYNFKYKDGSRAYGGYSDYSRTHERMVFPIPENLPSALAAPMLCAGVTVYSPLVRSKVGPGSRVGIVGIGGLGHFAIMFAKALGAEVTAISHTSSKSADAAKMGASNFITTSMEKWAEKHSRTLDIILCTSFAKDIPLEEYISMLDVGGTMIYVGIPESALPPLPPGLMIGNNSALRGSNTGSKKEVLEMLKLAADQEIKSWVEEVPMENCIEAVEKLECGEARYRLVLKV
ncbi:hypothetical protein VE03_05627 [Pseudogymnoascus sp. 23342-1-I1]|nr:hypothetical protein VE03_05627 [Pseudogymnoascus sp. 23342-1-I1]